VPEGFDPRLDTLGTAFEIRRPRRRIPGRTPEQGGYHRR
jgi:hypothetical protein